MFVVINAVASVINAVVALIQLISGTVKDKHQKSNHPD